MNGKILGKLGKFKIEFFALIHLGCRLLLATITLSYPSSITNKEKT